MIDSRATAGLWLGRAVFGVAALVAGGCAHSVRIAPTLNLETDHAALIDKRVGYRISDAQRALETTSAGGGGDKISYRLYRDLEPALFETLASVFRTVLVVPDSGADEFIAMKQLEFVFTPEFSSTSSSDSVLLWNATGFTLRLQSTASDATGKLAWSQSFVANGKGSASTSLVECPAAQAAAVNLFNQLQKALREEPVFKR